MQRPPKNEYRKDRESLELTEWDSVLAVTLLSPDGLPCLNDPLSISLFSSCQSSFLLVPAHEQSLVEFESRLH